MKHLILISVLLLAMGCSAVSNGNPKIGSESSIQKTFASPLTKSQVINIYGEPNAIIEHESQDVFEYKYVSVSLMPTNYIPLVGMFASGYTFNKRFVYIYFENEVMVNYETIYDSGKYKK